MRVVGDLKHGNLTTAQHPGPLGRDRAVVAIGFFDGVHRGHQLIIETARAQAREMGAVVRIVTFVEHPFRFFRPETEFRYLTTIDEKLAILEQHGVDIVHLVPFDVKIANTEAEDFCRDILARQMKAHVLVVGHDFALGKGRNGTIPVLASYGRELGFEVVEVGPVMSEEDSPISSTHIRGLIAEGDVTTAGKRMGHPYTLSGDVVAGDGRGRSLGFPTVNLRWPEMKLLPATGVYITRAFIGGATRASGEPHPAVTNVGYRPTFDGKTLSAETHILGEVPPHCEQARTMSLDFVQRLRAEQRFDSVDSICRQIRKDVELADEYFVQTGGWKQ